jgi:DNA-binding MarR family transcriptional regulator
MFSRSLLLTPGHLLRRAHQRAVALFSQLAGPTGLTPVQWIILEAIHAHPGAALSTISELVSLDKATVGSVVGRLADRGLLEIGQLSSDRRAKAVSLTKAGEEMSRRMAPVVEQTQRALMAPLTEDERTAFLVAIRKMIGAPAVVLGHAQASAQADEPTSERSGTRPRAAIVGVGRAGGRAVAVRLSAERWALTLVAREGNRAEDLANMFRINGVREVRSHSCSPQPTGNSTAPIAEAVFDANLVVFSGLGEENDPQGALARDAETLDMILRELAGSSDDALCIVFGPLAHAAPALDDRWREHDVRIAGVDSSCCSPALAAEFVVTLAQLGPVAGGTVVTPRSHPDAAREESVAQL